MTATDRFQFLFGPYETPLFEYGSTVLCEWKGEVEIVGITDAKFPWPIRKKAEVRGRPTLVIYGDLARAIRRETEQAVAHWWGITTQTVRKWRRALGVSATTEGTSRLRSEHARTEPIVEARRKRMPKPRILIAAGRSRSPDVETPRNDLIHQIARSRASARLISGSALD